MNLLTDREEQQVRVITERYSRFNAEDFARALESGQFVPYFQPLVKLRTGQLAGFEILARWQHPQLGMISPDEFIPIAERDGWIGALTVEILLKALACAEAIPAPLTLALNVSPIQLHDLSLPQQVRSLLEGSEFPAERLVIEITESALFDNLTDARVIAEEFKAMGCKLALDDFGTGYSSLLHLQSLPFDKLKVDRSFVVSMTQRRQSRKIVASVVGLGQSLDLTTVAEGIETREQVEMLLWLGCELGQGYLYGRPSPGEDLARMIAATPQRIVAESSPWKTTLGNTDAQPSQRMAHLQAVYDGAPVGLGFIDRDLRYVNLNKRLAEMNRIPVEEHVGNPVAEVIPDMFPAFEPYLRRALQGEPIADLEIRVSSPGTGGEQTRLVSYQPALDEAGEVVGVSLAVIDITDRRRAEDALRESEEHYRHMVELNPQILWIMDAEGRNLDMSPRWEQTTGMMKDPSLQRGWLDAVHPKDKKKTLESMDFQMQTGSPIQVDYRVRQRDGGWRWMRSRGTPRFDDAGKIVCWYGSVEDIHDLKRAEKALRAIVGPIRPALLPAIPVDVMPS